MLMVSPAFAQAQSTTATAATTNPTATTNTTAAAPTTEPSERGADAAATNSAVSASQPSVEQADRTSDASGNILQTYRRNNPYTTQLFASPTAILLQPGQTRFGLTEIVYQQLNFGLTDNIQLGVNSFTIVALGGDAKIGFSSDDGAHHVAVLAGLTAPVFDVDSVAVHTRAAYSFLFAAGGDAGMFNLSTGYMFNSDHADQGMLLNSIGFDIPIGSSGAWSLVTEVDMMAIRSQSIDPFERTANPSWNFANALYLPIVGFRHGTDSWGIQFGLTRPFGREIDGDILAIPVFDLSILF